MYTAKDYNIIWILIDSVRNYYTDEDDRGKLAIMDTFAKEAIEFQTAICSAPSTIMSVTAMMTGIPSMYHSRTYSDYYFKPEEFSSLPLLLEKEGYDSYGMIYYPDGRKLLQPVFGNIAKQYWTKNAKSSSWWNNQTCLEVSKNILNNIYDKKKFFLYTHFNCRYDPDTSSYIEAFIDDIKSKGLFENSIIIMNSDHGYPDPSRNISFEDKVKLGHDLILTDDNILTPLLIHHPDYPAQSIKDPVSSLDIMPTVLDLIGKLDRYDVKNYPLSGKSILPVINREEQLEDRIVRTDNRYIYQDSRVTSLRNSKHKLIKFFDQDELCFYDVEKDENESINLISNKKVEKDLNAFLGVLNDQEENLSKFHEDYIKGKLSKYKINKNAKVMFIGESNYTFNRTVINIFEAIGIKNLHYKFIKESKIPAFKSFVKTFSKVKISFDPINEVDYCFVILKDYNPRRNYVLRLFSQEVKAKSIEFVDYNFDIKPKPKHWVFFSIIKVIKMSPKMFHNPKLFFYRIYESYKKAMNLN
jgi:membrane-anchored protein YejM (alkaline phosphatase superfamily)